MSEKYRKEIEEILKQAEEVLPKGKGGSLKRQRGSPGGSSDPQGRLSLGRGMRISAGKIMLASIVLLLLALILGAAGVVNVVFFVVAGLVLFVIAYAMFFVRPGATYEKRWRGRLIEEQPSVWQRVRRWLKS